MFLAGCRLRCDHTAPASPLPSVPRALFRGFLRTYLECRLATGLASCGEQRSLRTVSPGPASRGRERPKERGNVPTVVPRTLLNAAGFPAGQDEPAGQERLRW